MRGNSGSFSFSFEARLLWSARYSNLSRAHFRPPSRIFSKDEMKRAQRDAMCPSVTTRCGKFSADTAGFCSGLHSFRPESRGYERRNSMRACRRASSLIVRPRSILRSPSPPIVFFYLPVEFLTKQSSISILFLFLPIFFVPEFRFAVITIFIKCIKIH